MQVMYIETSSWSNRAPREMSLTAALTPSGDPYRDGEIERLRADISQLQDITGRLLALLVEGGTITLDEGAAVLKEHGVKLVRLEDYKPGEFE